MFKEAFAQMQALYGVRPYKPPYQSFFEKVSSYITIPVVATVIFILGVIILLKKLIHASKNHKNR